MTEIMHPTLPKLHVDLNNCTINQNTISLHFLKFTMCHYRDPTQYVTSKDRCRTLVNKLNDDYWYVNPSVITISTSPYKLHTKLRESNPPTCVQKLSALMRNNHGLENL